MTQVFTPHTLVALNSKPGEYIGAVVDVDAPFVYLEHPLWYRGEKRLAWPIGELVVWENPWLPGKWAALAEAPEDLLGRVSWTNREWVYVKDLKKVAGLDMGGVQMMAERKYRYDQLVPWQLPKKNRR